MRSAVGERRRDAKGGVFSERGDFSAFCGDISTASFVSMMSSIRSFSGSIAMATSMAYVLTMCSPVF